MSDAVPSLVHLGIDPEAAARLLPLLDSFVKWELLRLLHDNPALEAGIEDLARYTGRDETEIKPATRALLSAGVLGESEGEFGHVYSLTKDTKVREAIDNLVEGFVADRLVRLAISSHILKAHREASRYQRVPG